MGLARGGGLEPISWFDEDFVELATDVPKAGSDSFALSEAVTIAADTTRTDSLALSEAVSNAATLAAIDGQTQGEAPSLADTLGASDAAALSEAAANAAQAAAADAAALSDAATNAAAQAASDAFSLIEQAVVQLPKDVSDNFSFSEATTTAAQAAAAESFAFSDAVANLATLTVTDAATFSDQASASEFADKIASDSFVLSEVASLANAIAVSDAITATDLISSLTASLAITDPHAMVDLAATLATLNRTDEWQLDAEIASVQRTQSISASDAITLMESLAIMNAPSVRDKLFFGTALGLYDDEVMADTPEAYWRLASTADETSNHPGSLVGAPQIVWGGLHTDENAAMRFTGGVGGTLAGPGFDGGVLGATGSPSVTLEAWVKVGSDALAPILEIRDYASAGPSRGYSLVVINGQPRFYVRSSGGSEAPASSSVNIDDGRWHHIVGVYNGSTRRIYVDGVQTASVSGAVTVSMPGTDIMRIGYDGVGGGRYPVDASIDEAAVYLSALSLGRIEKHYEVGATSGSTEVTNIDVIALKAAMDSWVFSESVEKVEGVPSPALRLPLTAAIVARAATAAVIKRLATAAVELRTAEAAVDPNPADADVVGNLGIVTIAPQNQADADVPPHLADADVPYGD